MCDLQTHRAEKDQREEGGGVIGSELWATEAGSAPVSQSPVNAHAPTRGSPARRCAVCRRDVFSLEGRPFPSAMIIPVRCFTCAKVIGNKYDKYLQLLEEDYTEGAWRAQQHPIRFDTLSLQHSSAPLLAPATHSAADRSLLMPKSLFLFTFRRCLVTIMLRRMSC